MSELSLASTEGDGNSAIRVKISDDYGSVMDIMTVRDRSKGSWVYNAYVDFFVNNVNKDVSSINVDIISALIEKYKNYVKVSTMESKANYNSSSIGKSDLKEKDLSMLAAIKKVKVLENMADFLREPRTITVYTINKFNKEEIARTTIELDADVITIIPRNVLNNESVAMLLLLLHSCNVLLINRLFEEQLKNFTYSLRMIANIIRWISLIPFGVSLIPSFSSLIHGLSQGSIPQVLFTVVSPILYRYAPKLLFRYVPNILFRIAPWLGGYLMKHKIILELKKS